MSSSMFIESSSLHADSNDYTSTSDSNLVVVYGRNGINFDDKGLENLIDEKKISSISVIRLTSPTPSMEEEEEEEAKLEEIMRRQDLDSAGNESSAQEDEKTLTDNEGHVTDGTEDTSDDEDLEDQGLNDKTYEENKNKSFPRRRGRQPNVVKQKKLTRRRKKERPQIVGLRFEEFYPPDDANAIIKEALKMAGLGPDRKSKEDLAFQLLVIKNDHCYTPFTSPSQMKAKLAADKLEFEKQSTNRKMAPVHQHPTPPGKLLFVRKKPLQKPEMSKFPNLSPATKDNSSFSAVSRTGKEGKEMRTPLDDDRGGEDTDVRPTLDENEDTKTGSGAEDEESECTAVDETDESDNDRDSDLDFDVNNPKGRRRKIRGAKIIKRPIGTPKMQQKFRRVNAQEENTDMVNKPSTNVAQQQKFRRVNAQEENIDTVNKPSTNVAQQQKFRRVHTQEENADMVNKPCSNASIAIVHRQKTVFKNTADAGRVIIRPTPTKIGTTVGNVLSPIIAALAPIPKKQNENKLPTAQAANTKPMAVKCPIAVQTSPQTHKEILIHKQIMSSPKTKGFTDLNTLMEQHEQTTSAQLNSSKPPLKTTATIVIPKAAAPLKGFMPLGVESASKNQLPAQISIQTHQSSSELEAEHDKQLDLINSIVQDEMQKPNDILMPAANIIENIPELVKMLESTEASLAPPRTALNNDGSNVGGIKDSELCDNSNNRHIIRPDNNTKIDDIDMSHTSLLPSTDADDDLPDDILQQVVDLIKDDRTLQEAVDVLGSGDSNDPITTTSNIANQNPPPLAPITQPINKNILEDIPHSSKSIIQMSISNVVSTTTTLRSTIATPNRVNQQIIKTSPLNRKEPIQIIRGNGRVITLPPIEAPTTRAKRRAQAQPSSSLPSTASNSPSSVIIPINTGETSLDSSIHANSSAISAGGSVNFVQEKKNQDSGNRRRCSKGELSTAGTINNQKMKRSTANKKPNKPKIDVDTSDSGGEDDDDPNKLWCICRQPHNNRFMICCDACEDWFHGTCVNITKAMGLEMEQKGIDWTCPKCLKKIEEQKQPKITDLLIKKQVPAAVKLSDINSRIVPAEINPVAAIPISTGNIQQDITKIQTKELNQMVVEAPKSKIQSGQFINLKDLTGKKVIIQTSASGSVGSKKLFVHPLRTTNLGSPIRTITVVKQIPCTGKQTQHHNIRVIKTIPPNQSTSQNVNVVPTTVTISEPLISCIVCKKSARPNSIYCNDDCIRKHSQYAWNILSKSQNEISSTGSPLSKNPQEDKSKKKSKGLFEEELSMADRRTKLERVNVFERKTGRTITGSSAPTFSNLRKWLQDNPTFEVILPGSPQALEIEKKQKLRVQHSSSPTLVKTTTSPPPLKLLPFSSSIQQKSEIRSNSPQAHAQTVNKQTLSLTPQPKPNKNITDLVKSSQSPPTHGRPVTPKQLQKYPQQVSIKADKTQKASDDLKSAKEKQTSIKRAVTTEGANKSTGNDEDIRLVVRRTLKEQLLQRIHDEGSTSLSNTAGESDNNKLTDIPKLSPEEIEEFTKATELEMYNCFNRDTGAKYKAKYRSILFNIKDRKNHTLYAKICGKLIEPKQLVRMSPEEMASQELAQWREQETKHQLEMIKKSELDLLTCAKNYVLKTHKGEEVIEGKSSEYGNVDITIPVEDVVSTLNKSNFSEEPSTSKSQADQEYSTLSHMSSKSFLQYDKVIEEEKYKSSNNHSKEKERERDKEKDKHREREREREKRHKSKDRHRDKSRSRKRSRSHSRSRSRDRSEKRHRSCHKDEKRDREKDRIKDRSDRDQQIDSNDKKLLSEKKTSNAPKPRESVSVKKPALDTDRFKTYNLVDKILESTKTVEEAANIVSDRNKDIDSARKTVAPLPTSSITSTTSSSSDMSCVIDIPAPPSYSESDQEPSSTVSIPTPPHDPYARFTSMDSPLFESNDSKSYHNSTLWTGNINMVDVTSFHLCLQPVMGSCNNLSKLLAKELDVVGRIGPETVWDYISKIKKSPNKEIVIIRLLPASETETAAYKLLYEYLEIRNRLGVIKSISPFIKDFYIYPLGAGKLMPILLRPNESVEFYDDPYRPDMLIGIIVRVVSKRYSSSVAPQSLTSTMDSTNKFVNRANDVDSQTPPGSPKLKKRRQSIITKDIDVDAIIKAPIVSKSHKAMPATTLVPTLKDADEPYSPGGSSDDDLTLLPIRSIGPNQMQTAEEELKRKMEEINRQIAAQEMEIAGLLTGETSKFGTATGTTSKVLANIAIPSNLSQILASIKPSSSAQEAQPAVPPPPPLIGSLITAPSTSTTVNKEYNPSDPVESPYGPKNTTSSSRLANLSEAELLSMVPDDIVITAKTPVVRYEEPPPPGV